MPTLPVSYPLGPPTVSGTTITVDYLLNNPTRILRDIALLSEQQFFGSKIFSDAGGVEGGALLFELPPSIQTDLYAERGIQEVAPGEEFPILTFLRGVPVVAKPRKLGGKWDVKKEARKRNDIRVISRAMKATANTIALTLDALAITVLNAAITANSRTLAGTSWATAAGVAQTAVTGTNQAVTNLLAARSLVENEHRGHSLNGLLVHPNQNLSLAQAAVRSGLSIAEIIGAAGFTQYDVSDRVTAGTALTYEVGGVGGWANEFPLTQDTWYENATERTWFQWAVSPAMFVDDPFAMVQLTGIA